jgi:hypothetical protein
MLDSGVRVEMKKGALGALDTTSIRTRERLGELLKFSLARPHEFFDHTSIVSPGPGFNGSIKGDQTT